jgi:hypothetical protein
MPVTVDRAEILRGLQIYHQAEDTFEIRILKTKYKTISGYFNNFNNAADAAISYNGEYAIYVTINPTNPRLIARANNKFKKYAENTTSDADVARLNWLPADCDPPRPAGISSTDEEHAISIKKCKEIKQWLIDGQGWPAKAFVIVDSGNGGYLLARIELENKTKNADLVKKCLEALDYLYSDETFHVDTTSANPARILRVPGTLNAKGDEVGDMRHRMAQILEAPDSYEVVPKELLEALAAMLPEQGEQPMISSSSQAFDPVAYCRVHKLQVHHTKSWTDRSGSKCTVAVLEQCIFNPDHRLSAVIIGWPNGARSYRCRHHSCLSKHWADAKAIIEPPTEANHKKANGQAEPEPETEISEEDLKGKIIFNPRLEVCLEPENFISKYMVYAKTTSDAYEEYHYASGLVLLSVAADRQIVVSMRHGDIYPNIWIFPLGDSTISRKTTAYNLNSPLFRHRY